METEEELVRRLSPSNPGEQIEAFIRRVEPGRAEEYIDDLRRLHRNVPPVQEGETLPGYFHRTDPL